MGETITPRIEDYQQAHQKIMEALVGPDQPTDGEVDNARAQLETAVALATTFIPDPTKVTDLTSLPEALAEDTPDAVRKLAARVAAYESDAIKPAHQVIAALDISGRPSENDYMDILSQRVMREGERLKIYALLAPQPS